LARLEFDSRIASVPVCTALRGRAGLMRTASTDGGVVVDGPATPVRDSQRV
jgi:hypothetical protein